MVTALDPGRINPTCAASNAVVPDPEMVSTGPPVRISRCSPSDSSAKIA